MKTPKTKKITYNVTITIGEGDDSHTFRIEGYGSRCKTIILGLQRAKKDICKAINQDIQNLESKEALD